MGRPRLLGECLRLLGIKNASDTLAGAVALTDAGRKGFKARGKKEPLGDARKALGETMKTPGDAGETIVTPGDAKESPTTAMRRSSMKGSLLGHSSGTKNTSIERRSDLLAKNGALLPEKRTISWAEVSQRGIKQ